MTAVALKRPEPQMGEPGWKPKPSRVARPAPPESASWGEKLDEAARLKAEGERLRAEGTGLLRQAAVLEAQAQRAREAEERAATPNLRKPDRLLGAAGIVAAGLGDSFTADKLAAELNVGKLRAQRLLGALAEMGTVRQNGRGAWDFLDPELARARDVASDLGEFTETDLGEALGLTASGARHYIGQMLSREMIELSPRGVGLDENLGPRYAWIKPAGTNAARPRHEAPEARARRESPKPVAGTGRRKRAGSPVVDKLIREASAHGVTIERSKHQIMFMLNGERVATSSKTPGASSLKETRMELRRAGVPV